MKKIPRYTTWGYEPTRKINLMMDKCLDFAQRRTDAKFGPKDVSAKARAFFKREAGRCMRLKYKVRQK